MDNLTIQFINRSLGADTFLWDFGDGVTSVQANPNHTYLDAGAYVVTLTATGSFGTSQASRTVITVGVLNDVLLSTASGDAVATAGGDIISVPAP